MSEQQTEQTRGEPGSVDASPTVPNSSETASEVGAAAALALSVLEAPATAPDHEAAKAEALKTEAAKEASKIEAPKVELAKVEPGRIVRRGLLARCASVHVDFHAHRHFDNLRSLPGHSILPTSLA